MKKYSNTQFPLTALLTALATAFPSCGFADTGSVPTDVPDSGTVIITGVRESSPLMSVTDTKSPRQPVPASDGADILKTIPGFTAIRNGGTNGDAVLRGMFGSRINILNDGTTMLGACPGRMDAPTSYISPANFDTLTIIKGPESVIWGPGASAGTVMFDRTTRRFDAPGLRGDGAVLFGAWGHSDVNIDMTAGAPQGYVRLTGSKGQQDDYDDGSGQRVPSAWHKWSADASLGWTPDQDTRLELNTGVGNGDARYAGRSMDGSQFKRDSANLKFKKAHISDLVQNIDAQIYYNDADHVMDNYSLRAPDPMSSMPMPMASQVERKTHGGRLAATLNLSDRMELVTGIDGSSNQHQSRAAAGINTYTDKAWTRDADMSIYGVFAQLNWQFSDPERLISGIRIDQAEATDRRMKTGMMKMQNPTYNQSRSATLASGFARYEKTLNGLPAVVFAGLGHAERFPDYWELFSPNMGPMGSVNAFSGVQPEKTTQLDIGIQYKTDDLKAWASLYAGYIQDYILFRYRSGGMMGSTSQASNVNAQIAGGEAGVSYRFARNWLADASVAYAWGRDQTLNQALPQMPPFDARLAITYSGERWSIGTLLRLVAAQNRIATGQGNVVGKDFGATPGFGTLALNAGYRISDTVQLTAGVDNLFNKTYAEHLNRAGDAGFGYSANTPVNEPGRTVWAKMNVKF